MPWARARWPLTADADRTAVSGQGSGGAAALYAGLTRPERFGRVLVRSPSPGRSPGEERRTDGGERRSDGGERRSDGGKLRTGGFGPRTGGGAGARPSSISASACTTGPRPPSTVRPSSRCCAPGGTGSSAPSTTAAATTPAGRDSWPTPWWRPSGRNGRRAVFTPAHEFEVSGNPTRRPAIRRPTAELRRAVRASLSRVARKGVRTPYGRSAKIGRRPAR
ncbi:alpha/beta hydrolase-fold protein [Streptomyces sp. SM13]|uniref:alpha/beta hydrolase-fold protein n=1 Tax=Streptomyces sp. SM13 TaxID=1983803 RepID=UPI0027E46700|nr:alpha/beta hydrolase-fold protein [Streptomyces sp. SM13]